MRQVRALVTKLRPKATVYFNPSPRVNNRSMFGERLFDLNTQQEIEDLPTAWGGYDNLPIEAKFHLGEGSRGIAMSGKFHKAWGEFGGFKSPAAIKYEAAAMISFGFGCNFGDQLHPSGMMDPSTYRNIGEGYAYVEKIEEYGPGGTPYSRLGLWLGLEEDADRGVSDMLMEEQIDFVIASKRNLEKLSTVIVPSTPCLSGEEAEMLNAWAKRGGKLIVIGEGAMDVGKSRFIVDVGADYVGPAAYDVDYTVVNPTVSANMVETPFLNRIPALRAKITTGEALARIREPFFSRSYEQYNGHDNTPYRLNDADHPAVVRNGNIMFFAHAIDKAYRANGMKLHRDLFHNARTLLGDMSALQVEGMPSGGRVSLLKQAERNRYIAHLLYSPVIGRGDVEMIEDFPRLDNVRITLSVPEKIRRVKMIPGDIPIALQQSATGVTIKVPPFSMHSGIVFEI
jgi:hypothetical protein